MHLLVSAASSLGWSWIVDLILSFECTAFIHPTQHARARIRTDAVCCTRTHTRPNTLKTHGCRRCIAKDLKIPACAPSTGWQASCSFASSDLTRVVPSDSQDNFVASGYPW